MSYDNAGLASQHAPRGLGVDTAPLSGLLASAGGLLDRLDGLLSCARRLNNKIHGPEPKAVNNQALPPFDPDAPIARKLENAHRLISEIDAELTSLESRL